MLMPSPSTASHFPPAIFAFQRQVHPLAVAIM